MTIRAKGDQIFRTLGASLSIADVMNMERCDVSALLTLAARSKQDEPPSLYPCLGTKVIPVGKRLQFSNLSGDESLRHIRKWPRHLLYEVERDGSRACRMTE